MDFDSILTSKNDDYFVTETPLDRSRSVSEPRVGHFDPILALRVENDAPLLVLGSQHAAGVEQGRCSKQEGTKLQNELS